MSDQVIPTVDQVKNQQKKDPEPPWESYNPVTCLVESAGKITEDDSGFFTEVRVLSGKGRGELVRLAWWKKWKDSGDWKQDTVELINACCQKEVEAGEDFWSYMLVDKVFEMTPFKSKKGYWNYKDIKPAVLSAEDKEDLAVKEDIDDIPF